MITEWLELGMKKGGPVGSVGVRRRRRPRPPFRVAVRNFVAALVLLGAAIAPPYYVFGAAAGLGWIIVLAVYLWCSYFIHPRPNLDNVGWNGTLLDHPFRISDDLNRTLSVAFLVLLPGRFVTESVVVFFSWPFLPTLDEIIESEPVDKVGADIFE